MAGGTFTITNVGVFGVDSGTPIITPGESAILASGRSRTALGGRRAARGALGVQLTLSFDHRFVDGELGSAFLATLARCSRNPVRMLAWG